MRRGLPFLFALMVLSGVIWAQSERNYREALHQLSERAEAGDAKAMYDLARLHDMGYDTIPIDSARSSALYILSAQQGYAPAMNYLGFRYYNGDYLSQNVDSALYWIRKAAENGDKTAAANLGYLLTESDILPHNETEAVKWLDIASKAGVPEAQLKLVELMKSEWQKLTPDSAVNLGIKYYTEDAPIVGVALIEQAASDSIPKAFTLLGDAYSKGYGVPYDHQKSVDYFFLGAVNGDPSAQFVLSELLEFFPDTTPSEGIIQSLPEFELSPESLYDPQFWSKKAEEAGVNDSESAFNSLILPITHP